MSLKDLSHSNVSSVRVSIPHQEIPKSKQTVESDISISKAAQPPILQTADNAKSVNQVGVRAIRQKVTAGWSFGTLKEKCSRIFDKCTTLLASENPAKSEARIAAQETQKQLEIQSALNKTNPHAPNLAALTQKATKYLSEATKAAKAGQRGTATRMLIEGRNSYFTLKQAINKLGNKSNLNILLEQLDRKFNNLAPSYYDVHDKASPFHLQRPTKFGDTEQEMIFQFEKAETDDDLKHLFKKYQAKEIVNLEEHLLMTSLAKTDFKQLQKGLGKLAMLKERLSGLPTDAKKEIEELRKQKGHEELFKPYRVIAQAANTLDELQNLKKANEVLAKDTDSRLQKFSKWLNLKASQLSTGRSLSEIQGAYMLKKCKSDLIELSNVLKGQVITLNEMTQPGDPSRPTRDQTILSVDILNKMDLAIKKTPDSTTIPESPPEFNISTTNSLHTGRVSDQSIYTPAEVLTFLAGKGLIENHPPSRQRLLEGLIKAQLPRDPNTDDIDDARSINCSSEVRQDPYLSKVLDEMMNHRPDDWIERLTSGKPLSKNEIVKFGSNYIKSLSTKSQQSVKEGNFNEARRLQIAFNTLKVASANLETNLETLYRDMRDINDMVIIEDFLSKLSESQKPDIAENFDGLLDAEATKAADALIGLIDKVPFLKAKIINTPILAKKYDSLQGFKGMEPLKPSPLPSDRELPPPPGEDPSKIREYVRDHIQPNVNRVKEERDYNQALANYTEKQSQFIDDLKNYITDSIKEPSSPMIPLGVSIQNLWESFQKMDPKLRFEADQALQKQRPDAWEQMTGKRALSQLGVHMKDLSTSEKRVVAREALDLYEKNYNTKFKPFLLQHESAADEYINSKESGKALLPPKLTEGYEAIFDTYAITLSSTEVQALQAMAINKAIGDLDAFLFPLSPEQDEAWKFVLKDPEILNLFNQYIEKANILKDEVDKALQDNKPLKIESEPLVNLAMQIQIQAGPKFHESPEKINVIQNCLILCGLRAGALQNYQLITDSITSAIEPLETTMKRIDDNEGAMYSSAGGLVRRSIENLKAVNVGGGLRDTLKPSEIELVKKGCVPTVYPGIWGKTSWKRKDVGKFEWSGGFAMASGKKIYENVVEWDFSFLEERTHEQEMGVALYLTNYRDGRGLHPDFTDIPTKTSGGREAISSDNALWARIDKGTQTPEDIQLIQERHKKILQNFEELHEKFEKALISSFVELSKDRNVTLSSNDEELQSTKEKPLASPIVTVPKEQSMQPTRLQLVRLYGLLNR